MTTVRELHDKAMFLAQLAVVARDRDKDEARARDLARRAYELERQAAELVPVTKESEPTRSVLYRSAASLAYQCREFEAALELVAEGVTVADPGQTSLGWITR